MVIRRGSAAADIKVLKDLYTHKHTHTHTAQFISWLCFCLFLSINRSVRATEHSLANLVILHP